MMDSGATGIFIDDKYRGDDHQETDDGIKVEVADQRTITSTSTDTYLSQISFRLKHGPVINSKT